MVAIIDHTSGSHPRGTLASEVDDRHVDRGTASIPRSADAHDALAGIEAVLDSIRSERLAQHMRWGRQHHLPNGTGSRWSGLAESARGTCDAASDAGTLSWRDILVEEVAEVMAEADAWKLRAELVQVAAVAVQWVQALDCSGCYDCQQPGEVDSAKIGMAGGLCLVAGEDAIRSDLIEHCGDKTRLRQS